MTRPLFRTLMLFVMFAVASCAGPAARTAGAGVVEVTLLQLNDLYEITPIEGGRSGGLARVATLRAQLLKENPNTYTLLAGDVLSPSALGTATVDGERLAGRQMVAVLNALGLDVATFGNHEFDLKEAQLQQRLAESKFHWTSANVTRMSGAPFDGVSEREVITARGPQGASLRIGIVGLTLDSNQPGWVKYSAPMATMRKEIQALAGQVDVVVALTHLVVEDDVDLAQSIPEIDLVLGGHEHQNLQLLRGADFTPVFKADANARSVYVHRLRYDLATRKLSVASQLVQIDAGIADDAAVAGVVKQWVDRGFAGFRQLGFQPEAVVARLGTALDGRDASVRNGPTALTQLLARAILAEVPDSELSLYNSGSIRIDDELPLGPVTQYDVIRVLPFGGKVQAVKMRGDLLNQVLEQGAASAGRGAFLQGANVGHREDVGWTVKDQPIDPRRWYRVAITDYLASGREQGLDFLKPGDRMSAPVDYRDPRMALIDQLGREFPP